MNVSSDKFVINTTGPMRRITSPGWFWLVYAAALVAGFLTPWWLLR